MQTRNSEALAASFTADGRHAGRPAPGCRRPSSTRPAVGDRAERACRSSEPRRQRADPRRDRRVQLPSARPSTRTGRRYRASGSSTTRPSGVRTALRGTEAQIALTRRRAFSGGGSPFARVKELTDGLAQGPHLRQAPGRGLDADNPAPLGGDPRSTLALILEQVELAGRGDHHRVRQVDRRRESRPGKGFVGHLTPFVANQISTW